MKTQEILIKLFESKVNEKVDKIVHLPLSGSDRKYFRITSKTISLIGVYNLDKKENIAFLTFTKHFFDKGLNVPKIFAENLDNNIYLLQDLGNTTLFAFLSEEKNKNVFTIDLLESYKKVLKELPKFQILAGKDLDYSVCYPRSSFDKQSMLWDLSYFKYYFLKLAQIPFDEQLLEDDFETFTNFLLKAEGNYFLYRDFQSRNIMLQNEQAYFIDYQGGRKGALQYDLASLLYDAKAAIPQDDRNKLLNYYLNILENYIEVDKKEFIEYYYGYVLIRIMQAMGAYGFRGFYERKEHFLASIPYAIENLSWILDNIEFAVELPTLMKVLRKLPQSKRLKQLEAEKKQIKLTVEVNSFSYKRGIPVDVSENGGGFVFDCRALHNPGRYDEYKQLTGKDKKVIDFLKKEKEADEFLNNILKIIEQSINKYQKRNFKNLMVNFGCTGGQHRSVYCAEKLAEYLRKNFDVNVNLRHREQEFM